MLEHKKIRSPEDFFSELNSRAEKGVYFYRINSYNSNIEDFLLRYYEDARKCGVIIEGNIQNPTEANLSYYTEMMGTGFMHSIPFIEQSLKKWLPRMNDPQRKTVAESIYNSLSDMKKQGKNDNMLKNAYIKYMCWLYFKFERIVNFLGNNKLPKILYDGEITRYELYLISILSGAGCDVVLLQYKGDSGYVKIDPDSRLSYKLEIPSAQPFPQDFSLKTIRENIAAKQNTERMYGDKPTVINCTNQWITGEGLNDIRKPVSERGYDPNLFYNCFCRINGVEDKLTYQSDLFKFYNDLIGAGRKVVIVENGIEPPTPPETAAIKRGNISPMVQKEKILAELVQNIQFRSDPQLRSIAVKAYLDIMLEEAKRGDVTSNKLANRAIFVLAWLNRYQQELFTTVKSKDIACFIMMGDCKTYAEALFIRFLSKMPVDVLILDPKLESQGILQDKMLYDISNTEKLDISVFPRENAGVSIGTAAYYAERELDDILYSDSGMYRDRQHSKAAAVVLRTMYEEIAILWDQELKYRPNFSAEGDSVVMPVIFAKVSGVKDKDVQQYWSSIKQLITEDTLIIRKPPYSNPYLKNPFKTCATELFISGRLMRDKIKNHKSYKYGFLRDEIQDHILDKIQVFIDRKMINGIGENGMEYAVVAQLLNLDMNILRRVQQFDFTKKNPKIIFMLTGEAPLSREDSILSAFLSLIGFDVLFFVPTGYQTVERHFAKGIIEEHQAGDFVYDLVVPDFRTVKVNTRRSWRDKIFKRGT